MSFNNHNYLLIFSLCILYVESADPSAQLCNQNSNTTNPEITKNIDSILTTLVQATSKSGYIITSSGSGKSQVFGLAQCRQDVPNEECSTCVQTAAKEIKTICPDRVDARIWYEYCWIRYNTENFLGQVDTGYGTFYYNVENVTDPKTFNNALGTLMSRINKLASAPGNKGNAKDQTKLSDFVTLYALSQCTQDLSQLSCQQCLAIAVGNFPTYCDRKKGCRIIYSSCYVRYELYPFYFPLDKTLALQSSLMTNYLSVIKNP
ncbi:cysteine-rich repeat secretory protein 55-like [Bidens hawaiensis]|uniref:cysteine-rich repeat secretory protein 55-like n=1 Tax=Bidens hawaiensis TaxID=980011 RepID=UPI00404A4959